MHKYRMPMNDNIHCIHRVTSNPFINSNIMKTGDDWMMNLTNNTETPDEKTTNITDGIHNYNLSSDKIVYTIFFIAVLATWCIYYRSSQRNESESEDEEEAAERNVHYTISRSNMNELIIAVNNYASNKIEQRENEQRTKIAKMKPIERQKYFNRLFEKTGNQIVLDQIIVTRNKNTINETEDVDKDIEKGICENCVDKEEEEDESTFIYLSLGTNNLNAHGNCIICFENFHAGDTIVFNSTQTNKNPENTCQCPHVYHKHCFVDYLAMKAKHNQNCTILDDMEEDPKCSTCRARFCSALPLDEDEEEEEEEEVEDITMKY